VDKQKKVCSDNQHAYTPFAFDTFGFLASEVFDLLHRVQMIMHSNVMFLRCINVMFTRVVVRFSSIDVNFVCVCVCFTRRKNRGG
jgi:hypothetical protein